MTILQSGTSLPIALNAGQTIVLKELSGVATVTGSSAAREDASARIGAGYVIYGPQITAGTVTLSTTGIVDYQVVNGDPTPANQPVLYGVDPSGPIVSPDAALAVLALGPLKWINVDPDDGSADQTAKVQAALNSCYPGQTAVLPPPTSQTKRYVRCGDITIPSGVSLETAGSSPLGWTLYFSKSLSQAFNSRIGRIWMKQCKPRLYSTPETGNCTGGGSGAFLNDTTKAWVPDQWKGCWVRIDSGTGNGLTKTCIGNTATQLIFNTAWSTPPDATSVYSVNSSISAITFMGTQFDGTDPTGINSTVGDCIELGQLAFDTKLHNVQIWNYTGWGLSAYGNPDKINNSGTPYLATGVFIVGDDLKIFNCGGGGAGGGIYLRGGPKDGGSLHLGKVLIDHCQQSLVVDDSVNGDLDAPVSGGGWVVRIDDLRNELCGKVGGGPETPTITNIRGLVTIDHLWHSSSITTQDYKNIWHRRGSFQVNGGRMVKGGSLSPGPQTYGIYCDQGRTAVCAWQANYDFDIGRALPAKANVGASTGGVSAFRFELVKAAAGKVTLQIKTTDGKSWGIGSGAGDVYSNTVSAQMTAGGAAVSVGNVLDKVFYEWKSTGIFRIYPDNRTSVNVLTAVIHKQNTAVSGLTADIRIQAAENGFRVEFYKPDGTIPDLANDTTMPVGAVIEFSCLVALNPLAA